MAIKKDEKLSSQQIKFLEFYLNVESDTFGNVYQSGLKAKYSKEYSENITHLMPKWLSENIGDTKLLAKVMRNLDKFLDDNKNVSIQADITKFLAKSLDRAKFGDKQTVDLNTIDVTNKEKKETGGIISKFLKR